MRYADISEPIGIPDVPALPTQMLRPIGEYSQQPTFDEPEEEEELLVEGRGNYGYENDTATSGYVGSSGGARRFARRAAVELDTDALREPNFDPDACECTSCARLVT